MGLSKVPEQFVIQPGGVSNLRFGIIYVAARSCRRQRGGGDCIRQMEWLIPMEVLWDQGWGRCSLLSVCGSSASTSSEILQVALLAAWFRGLCLQEQQH